MLAVTFFQHMENTVPLSRTSHISIEKLYGSLIFVLWKTVFVFVFLFFKIFFLLFDFQLLYGDIIGFSHLCILFEVQSSFWICYLISSVSFVSFLAVISSYINSLSLLSFPSGILITGDIFNIFTFPHTPYPLFGIFHPLVSSNVFFGCAFQFTKYLLWCI